MNWRRASIAGALALPIIALLAYGMTRDPKSIPSANELAITLADEAESGQGSLLDRAGVTNPIPVSSTPPQVKPSAAHSDAPYCMQCGVQMQRAGSCHACPSCGSTSGCS